MLINEFSYADCKGAWVPFQVQRYRQNYGTNQYFLEDYLINYPTPGFHWADTWVYTNDGNQVFEVYDSAPHYVVNWNIAPLNHGSVLYKGTPIINDAIGQITLVGDAQPRPVWSNYFKVVLDIKKSLTLPGGTFYNVAMQAEQQSDSINPLPSKYIFFFAPNKGIVAIQYLDQNWQKSEHQLLVLTKSCQTNSNVYRCP